MSQQPPAVGNVTSAALAEAAARQLTTSSLAGYQALPNPQAVVEGIRTGSTGTLSTALQEGNPIFQSLLAGAPAGGATGYGSPYGTTPTKVNDPTDNLWSFDAKAYQSSLKDNLGKDDNASWRSFGQVPQFNFGWMDSVRKSDPNNIKKWQGLLAKKGFYQDPKYQTSGVWDSQSEAAFQGFMISLATPAALFSTDPKAKGDASMFLNGLGFDISTLNARDPSVLAQIAQQWMGAQGPDVGVDTKTEVQKYADQFGQSALPQSYQAIIQNNFFQTLRDGLSSLPLIGDIPIIGGAVHGAVNLLTGNLDFKHLTEDPRSVRAQQIKDEMKNLDHLTPTDIANMAPALQAVKDDAGFLGFMDDYDHARTKFLLASIYSLGDMVTGKFDGHKDNPFDAMSGVNLTAQAHQDNMFAGLFGAQAAHDNPAWAGFFNFAANVVDDPTSYIPILGELEMVQKARGIRTVGRAIGHEDAKLAFSNLLGDTVKERVNDGYFKAMRSFVTSPSFKGDGDLGRLAGLNGVGTDHEMEQLRLVKKAVDPALDETAARKLWLDGEGETAGMGALINSGRGVYNAHALWSALPQVKSTKMFGRLRAMGAFEEHPSFRAGTNPTGTAQHMGNLSMIAGMDAKEIKLLLDKYTDDALNNPNKVLNSMHAVEDGILDSFFKKNGIKEAAFVEFVGKMRAGRSFSKVSGMSVEDRIVAFGPDARTGKETSLVVKAGDPDIARAQMAQVKKLTMQRMLAEENGATPDRLAVLDSTLNDLQRPVTMLTTQLADNYSFPYSAYEMLAFKNPVLRVSERAQAAIHMDAIMGTWKRITIGRISSAYKIVLGDDAIRPFAFFIGQGHFGTAFAYLTNTMLHTMGLVVPGLHKRVIEDTMKMIENNPEAVRGLQDISKYLQEEDSRLWTAKSPGDVGYAEALHRLILNHFSNDPLTQAWLKGFDPAKPAAAKKALAKELRTSKDPRVLAYVEARKANLSKEAMADVVDSFHNFMQPYMANNTIREMATSGKVNFKQLSQLVSDEGNRAGSTLPYIPAPNDTAFAKNMVQKVITKFPDMVFEHITAPAVNQARTRGFIKMKEFYAMQLRKYYAEHPGRSGDTFEKMIDNESSSRAIDWVINNTYQGTRSVMGGAIRNVFPFYGATSNMDRFYMRQASSTPFVGSLIAHSALKSQQSQSAANQASPGLHGGEGILSHLGFGGGEGVQFNPLHAFFLTADGIGSLVPGTGPVFSPLWSALGGNHSLAQMLADVIPGAQTQIDYNTGQAKPTFSWLADLISGTSLALTGQAPNLGPLGVSQDTINREVDSKVQQRERETGKPVGEADLQSIRQEVGRDLMLQGGLSFTLPVSPLVKDTQAADTAQSMDQWRQQTTDVGKDTIIATTLGVDLKQWQAAMTQQAGAPQVADLIAKKPDNAAAEMAYMDRRVSPEQRDAIASVAPWVVSSSTSKYQSAGTAPGEPTTAVDLAQWQVMRKMGDITLLEPNQFIRKIADERDINTGWQKYDSYKNFEYETMVANGWTSTTPEFKAWRAAQFDPLITSLQANHPAWWKQFGAGSSGTSSPDLAGKTRSLRTLQTWEVIPQHSDYENTQSILWRNTILLRDQAAQQIYNIRAAHGSRAETDMVMLAFQQQLQALAAQDPNFAAQLGSFRFGNWEDVVNLEANELATATYSGPRIA